jgi:hypothetical protein
MIIVQNSKRYLAGIISSNLKVDNHTISSISYGIPVASFLPSMYAYIATQGMANDFKIYN